MKEPLPPCDEDFALHETSPTYTCVEPLPEPVDDDIEDSIHPYTEDRSQWSSKQQRYPSMTKLLAMQRVLSDVTLDRSTTPKDKAACARAWRDLEVLRYAKQSRPLVLSASQKVEPKAKEPASIAIISDVASAA